MVIAKSRPTQAANPWGQIGETLEFDRAIKVAGLGEEESGHPDHRDR